MSSPVTTYPDLLASVPLPAVEPHSVAGIRFCPMCGMSATLLARIAAALQGGVARMNSIDYCRGGKEAVEQCGPSGMFGELVGRHEHVNPCAGILSAHLHLKCIACGFRRLMATCSTGKDGLL